MRKVAVFGNYIFAKTLASILMKNGKKVYCFCNDVPDDDKYGTGIQKYAQENNLNFYIGKTKDHLIVLKEISPDFVISVGYKYLIPVESLDTPVYGIHFGGLYGSYSVRGKSSSIWYRLQETKRGKVTLYRMHTNKFDIGDVLVESNFLLEDIEDDSSKQIELYESLLNRLNNISENVSLADSRNSFQNIASYFPKASINKYRREYFSDSEISLFKKAGLEESKSEGQVHISVQTDFPGRGDDCYCYTSKMSNQNNSLNVVYLHGFGSKFSKNLKNNKLVKIASLSGQNVIAPVLKCINGIYCNGNQRSSEIVSQFHRILSFAERNNSVLICTSISCLVASEILPLYKLRQVIFVTPIISLRETPFDPGIIEFLSSESWANENIELRNEHLSSYKISAEFLEYLKHISILENLAKCPSNYQIILSSDDHLINAEYYRSEFVEICGDINKVNVIDGHHTFRSPLQLYYLACQMKKALS
jgi:predicted esterase YcpF (UPF0227 family)